MWWKAFGRGAYSALSLWLIPVNQLFKKVNSKQVSKQSQNETGFIRINELIMEPRFFSAVLGTTKVRQLFFCTSFSLQKWSIMNNEWLIIHRVKEKLKPLSCYEAVRKLGRWDVGQMFKTNTHSWMTPSGCPKVFREWHSSPRLGAYWKHPLPPLHVHLGKWRKEGKAIGNII